LIFAVVFVVVMIPLALVLALALNRSIPGRSFFRAAFFMPYITPGVVVAIVFIWVWQTQNGILNTLLGFVGIPPSPGSPPIRNVKTSIPARCQAIAPTRNSTLRTSTQLTVCGPVRLRGHARNGDLSLTSST
jgi:ABC-type sugar transport system permease subunit